jgi:hypothetical protein
MSPGFALRTSCAAWALLLCPAATHAQTVYALDAAAATVVEFTGPPAGPCLYPSGPVVAAFPTLVPFACPTSGPALAPPAGVLGDIAVNHVANTVWTTDGIVLTEFTPAGAPLRSFPLPPGAVLPGPLTGLGYGAGTLWITDGAFLAGIVPPVGAPCAPAFAVVVPPWPAPPGLALLTDVAHDPATGSLWVCSVAGFAANVAIGAPVLLAPPFVPLACGALGPLFGIAVDTARPGAFGAPVSLYVTNGFLLAYVTPPGAPAPPSFYTTAPCAAVPAGPVNGLASSLHGIRFGAGFDPLGGPAPIGASAGQSTTPSATFALTLASASPLPGTTAALFVDFAALCPPLKLKGNPLVVLPTLNLGPFPVIGGAFTLPAPIPVTPFVGLSVFTQWIVVKGGGAGIQVANGVEFTIGLP